MAEMGYGSRETGSKSFSPSYAKLRTQALPAERDNNTTTMPGKSGDAIIRQIPKSAGSSINQVIPKGASALRGGYTGDLNKK